MPTFTYEEMQAAYNEHGDALIWLTDDGGEYSANPSDYWQGFSAPVEGVLAVRIPESFEII